MIILNSVDPESKVFQCNSFSYVEKKRGGGEGRRGESKESKGRE